MNVKNLFIVTAMTIFMTIAGSAYAGGGIGGNMGMMGGQAKKLC